MNMLTQLNDALASVNDMDRESRSILGLFRQPTAATESRSMPAFGSYRRRREAALRNR